MIRSTLFGVVTALVLMALVLPAFGEEFEGKLHLCCLLKRLIARYIRIDISPQKRRI
jgi:hypothetical protein